MGCFISPTLTPDLPVYGSEEVYLTNVPLTQELTDAVSVFTGKMDTLGGVMNAFAHGRGKTQFSNMGSIFNPISGATVRYSTLGAGFVVHPGDGPMVMVTVLDSAGTTATSGFDTLFNDGILLSAAVRVPTNFLNRPGHQLLGGTWNSRTHTSIIEAYIPYPDVAIPTTRGSWCLCWNFDQVLFVDPADDTRLGTVWSRRHRGPEYQPDRRVSELRPRGLYAGPEQAQRYVWHRLVLRVGQPPERHADHVAVRPGRRRPGHRDLLHLRPHAGHSHHARLQYVVPTPRLAEPAVIAGVRPLMSF